MGGLARAPAIPTGNAPVSVMAQSGIHATFRTVIFAFGRVDEAPVAVERLHPASLNFSRLRRWPCGGNLLEWPGRVISASEPFCCHKRFFRRLDRRSFWHGLNGPSGAHEIMRITPSVILLYKY
jgi:hypothetical protein